MCGLLILLFLNDFLFSKNWLRLLIILHIVRIIQLLGQFNQNVYGNGILIFINLMLLPQELNMMIPIPIGLEFHTLIHSQKLVHMLRSCVNTSCFPSWFGARHVLHDILHVISFVPRRFERKTSPNSYQSIQSIARVLIKLVFLL